MLAQDCDFLRLDASNIRCRRCNYSRRWTRADLLPKMNCRPLLVRPPGTSCVHRGGELRRQECSSCQGRVQVKVFACPLHGECTVEKPVGVQVCESCPDRKPPEDEAPPRSSVLLNFRHGLGDNVQFTVVLRHLAELRPDLDVDVECYPVQASLFRGLCRRVLSIGELTNGEHDVTKPVSWREPDQTYPDSPSTKAEKHLREVHGITPRLDLCYYRIAPRQADVDAARQYAAEVGRPFALLHYQGSSYRSQKNLPHHIAVVLCRTLLAAGVTPVVLDWTAEPTACTAVPGVLWPGP